MCVCVSCYGRDRKEVGESGLILTVLHKVSHKRYRLRKVSTAKGIGNEGFRLQKISETKGI